MVNLESNLSDTISTELTNGHLHRLANAMAPDCREWVFEGDVQEDDSMSSRCTCGHPIKYIFWLHRKRDGRRLPIGSTCITSSVPFLISHGAQGLASELAAAQESWRQMMADRMKQSREGKRTSELERVREEATRLQEWYSRLLRATEQLPMVQNGRMPYRSPYFYEAHYRDLLADTKEKSTGRKVALIKRRIDKFREEAWSLKRCWYRAGCEEVWSDPPKA